MTCHSADTCHGARRPYSGSFRAAKGQNVRGNGFAIGSSFNGRVNLWARSTHVLGLMSHNYVSGLTTETAKFAWLSTLPLVAPYKLEDELSFYLEKLTLNVSRFEVFTAISVQIMVVWIVSLCSLVDGFQCFGWTSYLRFHGDIKFYIFISWV
jgi:hypothetical protein